ncbi:hypothetical protein [Caldalkalibacillus mannanilyticus]|uniref:hypothetical protein n=1 Tax=Caldalkalibacillus mannanilyticus TaxID=1418 RepID=UPI00046A25E6|nr:hypothetical protein [Caldalkalibacillus mannanilyticus]
MENQTTSSETSQNNLLQQSKEDLQGTLKEFKENPKNFFEYAKRFFKSPDEILENQYKGLKSSGLLVIIMLVTLLLLNNLVTILSRTSLSMLKFSSFSNPFTYGVSYALIFIITIFAFKQILSKQNSKFSLDFIIEKFGALLLLPCALYAIAIPLNILNLTVYGWISGMGHTFIYLAVFMFAYLYLFPKDIKKSALALMAYYILTRLLFMLL